MFFLFLLALASQRIEHVILSVMIVIFPNTEWLVEMQASWIKYERGSLPHIVELLIICWVQGLVWQEFKVFWKNGLIGYLKNLWNLANIMSLGSFMAWMSLRALAWLIVQKERWDGVDPDIIWIPKEEWATFEPQLLAEAMFCAGMIASYMKVVHILSINPYLGPLQIALGKMVLDIMKWMFLFLLVVFAFGCGINQLLWYYSDLERQQCYSLPGGEPDWEDEEDACGSWRRFANLWETSQSLFWASFGLVDLEVFDLEGIGEFTRFWGLLMFGSYSVCNIIVLLNMLIAMMSNSYQIIYEKSDTEWKFSRSKLWISYFEPGSTVPPPFNLIPTPKSILKILTCKKLGKKSFTPDDMRRASDRYFGVMKFVIRRYVTNEQRKSEDFSITEDDIQEVRQDISSFKYELLDILRSNNMTVPQNKGNSVIGRKSKTMERKIQKGFNLNQVENVMESMLEDAKASKKPKDIFKRIAKMVNDKDRHKKMEAEGQRRSSLRRDQIGSTSNSIKRQRNSLKKSLLERGNSQADIKMVLTRLNSEELVAFNPMLAELRPEARRAYAKFKDALNTYNAKHEQGVLPGKEGAAKNEAKIKQQRKDSIRKLVIEKAKSIESSPGIDDENSAINKAVKDLEDVIDGGGDDGKGVVNKAFDDNEAVTSVKPKPPVKPEATPKESSSTQASNLDLKQIPTPSNLVSDTSKKASPVASPRPSPKMPKVTLQPATLDSQQLATDGDFKQSKATSQPLPAKDSSSPKKVPAPQPSTSTAPAQASEASTSSKKSSPKPSPKPSAKAGAPKEPPKEEDPVGKFDPDGKSITGQKRTGWL
jgi:transient receptor potential cation channel subfamily C